MADHAKYEALVNDLTALEARVSILKSKYNDTLERNTELEVTFNEAEQVKSSLHQRISDLEGEIESLKLESENAQFKNLTLEERESLIYELSDQIVAIEAENPTTNEIHPVKKDGNKPNIFFRYIYSPPTWGHIVASSA